MVTCEILWIIQRIVFYSCFQNHKHMKMVALRLFSLCSVDSNAHRIVSAFIVPKREGRGNSIKILETGFS